MSPFASGPFIFSPAARGATINSRAWREWALSYGSAELAARTLPDGFTQDGVREAFADDIARFASAARADCAPDRIELIDYETGDPVAHFASYSICGMTPGLIDDRSRYWLRSADRLRSRAVTLTELAAAVAENMAPRLGWIVGLLPDEVLTDDPAEWRAPTNWEIRHIVGEGSFTGISGAKAADLVGVTPQNFRKYTAADSASTRQKMSFAMWHLLLHKLGVQRA